MEMGRRASADYAGLSRQIDQETARTSSVKADQEISLRTSGQKLYLRAL
jgi:hypothetical protein